MINCCKCIHFFDDWSVGYIDCKVVEKLPDDIYEDYEEHFPEMVVCPYYEEYPDDDDD